MKHLLTKKKKILHTTTRLVLGGGVEKNIYYTVKTLGNEFEFHLSCGADFKDDLFVDHPEVKIILCPHLINTIHPLKDLKALWFYYRLIRKEKYDIVHTHETKASFITKLAAWLARCPYVIYGLHGVTFNDPMSAFKRKFYIFLEKLTIRCTDLIVAVGNDTIEAYHKENIGKNIPYEVVRSGVDIDDYLDQAIQTDEEKLQCKKSMGMNADDIVMITVGRFSYSKAQRYAIQAFAALQRKYNNLKFLLIGEGELLEDCKTLAKKLGIVENSIYFLGYQKDIPRYLSISDLFIFTSLREGLPRVTVEASLMKVPIVAFEVEGIREVITHEQSGYIVKQYDVEALTFYARKLLMDINLRQKFTQNSYNHVIKNWDSNLMAIQLREIYSETPV